MKAVQLFCVLILTIALSTIETGNFYKTRRTVTHSVTVCLYLDAGSGIRGGTVNYTIYLGDKSACYEDNECLQVCKDQAKNPDGVVRVRCLKFVGNIRRYCCCYAANSNACCQYANSGLDCIPS